MQIIRGRVPTAQRVIIYGTEGIGKSTLASKFPNPVFIDTEGSTRQFDFARLPEPTSWSMLRQQVDYIVNNPDVCETLVIDTADWAETLAKNHILARDKMESIEDYGYGKGYVLLGEEFGRLLNRLNDVIDRGIHVVFVAHAHLRKFEQPGEAGSYDRWEMKLERRTAPLLKEWGDMVLFVNYKLYVTNVDNQGVQKGRNIVEGGRRVMNTTHHPTYDAKNRHGLPDELEMDFAPIAHCFPSRAEISGSVAQPAAPVTQPAHAPEPAPAPEQQTQAQPTQEPGIYLMKTYWHHPESSSVFAVAAGEPLPNDGLSVEIDKAEFERLQAEYSKPAPADPTPASLAADELEAAGVPRALTHLMRTNNVTLLELQAAVASRGYYPPDTPFANYAPDFIDGVLISAWPQVLELIQSMRSDSPF